MYTILNQRKPIYGHTSAFPRQQCNYLFVHGYIQHIRDISQLWVLYQLHGHTWAYQSSGVWTIFPDSRLDCVQWGASDTQNSVQIAKSANLS